MARISVKFLAGEDGVYSEAASIEFLVPTAQARQVAETLRFWVPNGSPIKAASIVTFMDDDTTSAETAG